MNGEVVDTLLGLLDQRVAIDLPGELFRLAIDLFQRLIDGNSADRHRRVANDPLARLVDVFACGEIHHRVGAPSRRPRHLLDFLADRGGERRIADVGVDLHQEVAADGHRLGFRVIDVRRDDGAAARDFAAHKLRRDSLRNRRAEALSRVLARHQRRQCLEHRPAPEIFANGDEFHLGRDDSAARVMHLRHVGPRSCAARLAREMEAHADKRRIVEPLAPIGGRRSRQRLDVTSLADPPCAQRLKA